MNPNSSPQLTSEDVLNRAVHPGWVREGRPTSQAFQPTKKDDNKLSVNQNSIWNAEQSFRHHTMALQLDADGIWCFSVTECSTVQLLAYHDPITNTPPNPSHAFVDFSGNSQAETKKKAKILRSHAENRGKQFPI